MRPSKEITFFASKTQITTKQGLAKENKFNTVLCKCKKLISSKKSQPYYEKQKTETHNIIFGGEKLASRTLKPYAGSRPLPYRPRCLYCLHTTIPISMREEGKPRVQGKVLIALAICLMVQQYLSAPDFHAVHDDSWLAPVHILTAEELTGNPEPGSISCPSPLYPVYDRIVDQESNRRIPRMIHVTMKSRCLPVCRLSQTIL